MELLVPKGNEKELLTQAIKLGWKKPLLCYNKLPTSPPVPCGLFVRQAPKKRKKDVIYIHKATPSVRGVLERGTIAIVYNLEFLEEKDAMFQRRAGFNHVFAKIAKRNNITIAFLLTELQKAKKKHVILGRAAQNLRICKKYGVPYIIASGASHPIDLRGKNDVGALTRELLKWK